MADLIGLRIAGKIDDKAAATGGSGGWPFDNVRTVSQTDANADHATIAAAIAAASAGDVILLDAETFTVTAAIAVNKAVAIIGHPLGTIVNCSTASVSIFNVTAAARLQNLQITHTAATGADNSIFVDAANVVVKDCVITLTGAATINVGIFHNSGNGLRVQNTFITSSGATFSYAFSNQVNSATVEIYGGKLNGATWDIHGSVAGSTLLIVKPVLTNSLISYSGTLSGDYESAAGDIKQVKASNDIFLGGDEAGVKKREIDIFQTSITDHFDGSALDAAWTWAAYTGFVTPGGVDLTHPSLLSIYLTGAQSATSKAFAYYSTYGSTILARCQCLSDVRAGLRMDDGTDDNYVETWLEYQSGLMKLRSRRSSATVVTGPTDIWATAAPIQFVTLRIATNTTSSYLVSYTINGSTLIFVANLTPTAITYTRSGIFYEQILNTVAAARAGVFDWYKQ